MNYETSAVSLSPTVSSWMLFFFFKWPSLHKQIEPKGSKDGPLRDPKCHSCLPIFKMSNGHKNNSFHLVILFHLIHPAIHFQTAYSHAVWGCAGDNPSSLTAVVGVHPKLIVSQSQGTYRRIAIHTNNHIYG